MWVEQSVFTSITRGGRSGYHVVSRSPGVSDADARALAAWSPSQGGLIVDDSNRASLNVHPLNGGRLAVSRTCQGPPEYSGRGGRQLYTHAIILDESTLREHGLQPVALYRDALALGHFHYRREPGQTLAPVRLTTSSIAFRPSRLAGHDMDHRDAEDLDQIAMRLTAGESLTIRHIGNRLHYAERLLEHLDAVVVTNLSMSTSLEPSASRPFQLSLIA